MAKFLIVTEKHSDWQAYFPSDSLINASEYLQTSSSSTRSVQVINLCRNYEYLSHGYYVSLMAEARGHRVLPSVRTLNDLQHKRLYTLDTADLSALINQSDLATHEKHLTLKCYFGTTPVAGLDKLAQQLFDSFPVPVLEVRLTNNKQQWSISKLQAFAIHKLNEEEQGHFAAALERFSAKIWRARKPKKSYRYDLAILVDKNESMPPSDATAIARFIRAGRRLGINTEMIYPEQIGRLAEYDALFIRVTTAIDHYSYRFAKRAEKLGLVVIDDPSSILRCCNKVYLTALLQQRHVPTPKSQIISRANKHWLQQLCAQLNFPMILKIPDGSFSRGVVKIHDQQQLQQQTQAFFTRSALLLVQEYMPTDFDWRIGVLNRQLLFACKYFMSDGHWQIYQHHQDGQVDSGDWQAMDIREVPASVRDAALRSASPIGDGLYGVDVKQVGDKAYVIEVNDNPSIDSDVEDQYLGELLYERIMTEFLRRLQLRGLS